ncbi:hypothetical protein [Thermoproteus tenax]|nr:hypothetical protein [Thermoproteus tenax]
MSDVLRKLRIRGAIYKVEDGGGRVRGGARHQLEQGLARNAAGKAW